MSEPKQPKRQPDILPQPSNPNLELYGNPSGNADPGKEEREAEHADPERFPGKNSGTS